MSELPGITLSPQQADAVNAPNGQVLLLAVPGAGKTTVVTARAARLILDCGVPAEELLILTYNRTAARDMERRWDGFFGEEQKPRFSTIHSFCYRLLGEYARMRGTALPRLLEGESTGGRGKVLTGLYRELTGQFLPEEQLNQLENLLGYCVNMQCTPEELLAGQAMDHPQFPELCHRYTAWKREQKVMDFDDMLLFAYTALLRSTQLRQRISKRYSHILVDEAQDTSKLQQELIALLVRKNLFMVGDEDQSIYGFRGAYPRGLMAFFERYPSGQLMKLEQNYRSTPEIVQAADRLIRTNTLRYPKEPFTRRESGAAVRVLTHPPMEQQYRTIALQCVEAAKTGSCAVLYRNSFSGIGVAAELRGMGVPYWASESRLGYLNDFITRDIANILRLARHPGDGKAFHQVYFRLGCGISREQEAMAAAQPREDILEWIIESGKAYERSTGKLLFVQRILRQMGKKKPIQQLDDILEELGYLDTLEKRGPTGYLMSSYLQKLCIIRRLAEGCGTAEELLGQLANAEQLLQSHTTRTHIRLSTVHSAKGQEYDHIIVADALEGIFPASDAVEYSSLGDREQMEEEARLFYTAMTRAKNTLTLYAPAKGLGRELLCSRFLAAAGLVEQPTVAGGARVGMGISHTFFGAGSICEINTARRLVTVDFKHYGCKTFGLESLTDPKLFKLFQ